MGRSSPYYQDMWKRYCCLISFFQIVNTCLSCEECVRQERDLGILVSANLKSSQQCTKASATARQVIAMVRRNFRRLDVDDFKLIYKTYIRPHLVYCIQAWSPYLLNSTQLNEHLWTQVLKHLNVHIYLVTIAYRYYIINLFRVLICRRFRSGRPQNHN